MDRRSEEFETDSTVDNTIDKTDPSDPEIHFREQARGIDAGQLLAGNFEPVAVDVTPTGYSPGLAGSLRIARSVAAFRGLQR